MPEHGHHWYAEFNSLFRFAKLPLGLLPLLKSIHKNCNLKKFAGQTIGVDAYGWLHRGTVACAIDLALGRPTTKSVSQPHCYFYHNPSLTVYRYVEFAMHRVRMLIYFGVIPYLVFDGDNLPSKAGTESDRAKRRNESRRRGLELYKAGKISQAQQELQKAVDVTPLMARQLIEELRRLDVQYVVAPYEADAQLVYLEAKSMINGILSEDSDLLVFGAKRLLTKLDQHGDCVEINRADFPLCREISLVGWSDAEFRRMAILSGCDYLPSINKMGLKTAYRYVRKYKNAEKVLRMLQFEGQLTVPAGYLEKYQQAELTFLHHRVFCPIAKKLVFLTELEPGMKGEDLPYIGGDVDPETAIGVACGDLDPTSKAPIVAHAPAPSSKTVLAATRRQTLATVADLKPNKSIGSFFKTKRQPLAELDPNSLTPSPSQQRLLAANLNASWEAHTVSSAPQLGRPLSSMSQPQWQSPAPPRNTDRTKFLAQASVIATYQPPKRQRLCSEPDEPLATGVNRSRFFNSRNQEPSPSVRKHNTNKKAKKSDFGVFSDDSVENILLELPDIGQPVTCSNLEKLEQEPAADATVAEDDPVCHDSGFSDQTQAVPESSPLRLSDTECRPSVSAETSLGETNKESQSTLSDSVPTSWTGADADAEAFEDLLDYHVQKQDEVLGKTFIGQAPPRRESALSSLKRDSKHVRSRLQGQPCATNLLSKDLPSSKTRSRATVEARRGADMETGNKLKKTFMHQPLSQQAAALKSLVEPQPRARKSDLNLESLGLGVSLKKPREPTTPLQCLGHHALQNAKPAVRADTSAPQQRLWAAGNNELFESNVQPLAPGASHSTKVKGSEDLVVPSSDDERESDGAEEETLGQIKTHLDLAKFAFTPK